MNSEFIAPRFVPTLTDVVHPIDPIKPFIAVSSFNSNPAESELQHNAVQLEEQMVSRVMQRVDAVLESRLREAVARVTFLHTQALELRLREEIERVVRESVNQALAQELSSLKK